MTDKSHEAFEKWFKQSGLVEEKYGMWFAWQAARASMLAELESEASQEICARAIYPNNEIDPWDEAIKRGVRNGLLTPEIAKAKRQAKAALSAVSRMIGGKG